MVQGRNNLFIGVDIGGTRTKYGLINIGTGSVLQSVVKPTERNDSTVFIEQVEEIVSEFTILANSNSCNINGIGFGVPGFTTKDGVVMTTYGFLDFMENYPIRALVEQKLKLPCKIDNDARVVALGEALYGMGEGYGRVLTLTLGTGLGLGLVVNGQFTDENPLAHMGGHLKISEDGESCYCGKTGCLESLVSATGILNEAKKYQEAGFSPAEIFEAARNGNVNAVAVVSKVVHYLHIGIHNYVNLFAPDMIVLGGGIAKGLGHYIDEIKGSTYLSPFPGYDFQLAISTLEELAGMLGGAALFRQ
ncbi:ROK family protein [Flavitalea antarctica]